MTLWKVNKYYNKQDKIYYEVSPYNFIGHLKCCFKWYGWKGLRWCYLFKWQAELKAKNLTKREEKMHETLD